MNMSVKDVDYDIVIVGGGVSGAAIAWTLSHYDLRIALVDKEADFCFGVSKANSGIIHAGFHHDLSSLKSRLEIRGNLMFDVLCYQLKFPFRRCGIIVAAFSEEELEIVNRLYEQGMENGVPGLELCSHERLRLLEPELSRDTVGGLFAPSGGVIEPYIYVFSLIESARQNGVDAYTGFEVAGAERGSDKWIVESRDGRKLNGSFVINAAGLYADRISEIFGGEKYAIIPRKGEEYLLDCSSKAKPQRVIFPVPAKNSKGTLVIPTVEGTIMIGPTAEAVDDRQDTATSAGNMQHIMELAGQMVPAISRRDIITGFSGLRPTLPGNDFYIGLSEQAYGFVQVAGIQSPGLTASPAIGEYVKDILKRAGVPMQEKTDFRRFNRKTEKIHSTGAKKLEKLIAGDPAYGNIVCRCEMISEAEIVRAIHLGHTTIDGIKFYTRAGMGRCQGGFCAGRIIEIIHRETGIPVEQITKRGGGSQLIAGRLDSVRLPEDVMFKAEEECIHA